MIANKIISKNYLDWNKKWGAPFGNEYSPRPEMFSTKGITDHFKNIQFIKNISSILRIQGMFAFQGNSSTRTVEYPWAYYSTPLKKEMKVLEIGGGLSGFQFVLSKEGLNVINVDPNDDMHGWVYTQKHFELLNKAFKTHVKLIPKLIEDANLNFKSFDRIFCISVIEHLTVKEQISILNCVYNLLKKNGFFILTIDLFLDLFPFSDKKKNEFGTNVSVSDLIKKTGFELYMGNKNELYGFKEFDPKKILAKLDTYYIGATYPVLPQMLVLLKR